MHFKLSVLSSCLQASTRGKPLKGWASASRLNTCMKITSPQMEKKFLHLLHLTTGAQP